MTRSCWIPLLTLPAIAACQKEATCEAAVDPNVATVIEVAATGLESVDFGTTEALGTTAPTGSAGEDGALLLGLPPLTDVHWSASLDGGDRCEGVTRTGGLPAGLPDITVTRSVPEAQAPYRWLLASVFGGSPVGYVIDREGGRVWYHLQRDDRIAPDLRFARDGATLLHNEFAMDRTEDVGRIARISWTGEELESIPTELGHHAFDELPDGTLAWLAIDVRPWYDPDLGKEVQVAGDAIVELAPGGEPRVVWSAWDDLAVRKHLRWDDAFYPDGLKDWTHGNGLRWHEPTDSWIVSLGHVDTVAQVSRDGELIRAMGRDGLPVTEGVEFHFQHDAQLTPEGTLLLFTSRPDETGSGGAEYVIDDEKGELRQVWGHGLDETIHSIALGQVLRFENGNTLVNFGGAGLLREVTPDDEVVWEAHTDSGSWFAQVHPFDDFYAPVETSP